LLRCAALSSIYASVLGDVSQSCCTACGASTICGVAPTSGAAGGGTFVTITGYQLGSGTDIYNVTLAGKTAPIRTQGEHWVLVVAGYQSNIRGLTGNVVVYSTSKGIRTLTNGYTYNPSA
jgi:hypothetical protein